MRNSLLLLHRLVALVMSGLIFIVAVTGSVLNFEGAMDRALNPELWQVTPGPVRLSLDTLTRRAEAEMPHAEVTRLSIPREIDRAYLLQAAQLQIFVDPYTGSVLGARTQADYDRSLPRLLHRLHASFMAGAPGGAAVVLVTLAALFLTVTGMMLWWQERAWRVRWSASWKRIVFDLHHTLGIVASLAVLVIGASGVVMGSSVVKRAIVTLDGRPVANVPTQPLPGDGARELSLDALAQIARTALPGAHLSLLSRPTKARMPAVATMKFAEDRSLNGRSRVHIDRHAGMVLLAESSREAGTGTAFINKMESVHTGSFLGTPMEAVWFLAALILASQSVTGMLMWWNGRAARTAVARKSPV